MAGFGVLASGAYSIGTIKRQAFQEAPWAGGGTVDLVGLTFDASTAHIEAIDLIQGGTILAQNNSALSVGALTLGSAAANGQSGTFSVQSGSQATISGAVLVSKGTLNIGHITLGSGTVVELDAGVKLAGYGSLQVYGGAAGHVTGDVEVDDISENLPGGLAGGIVVRGTGGALTVDGDVTIGATQHGLFRVMQGGAATISGELVLARDAGSSASLDISGTNTVLTVSETSRIGVAGTATVTTSAGETANFEDGLSLATTTSGVGTVSMFGGTLKWGGDFVVGEMGDGALSVVSGARALGYDFTAKSGSGDMQITDQGSGIVTVSGNGSVLTARNLTIGKATADVDDCDVWTYTGGSGKLSISGGAFVAMADTLTLNNAEATVGPNQPVISLAADAAMEIGGDTHAVAGHLVIDPGGTLTGHGIIAAAMIDNNGDIRVHKGVLETTAQITGNGTVTIEGQCEFYVQNDLDNEIVFEGSEASILRLDDWRAIPNVNPGFAGTISGLDDGDTIAIKQFAGMPELSHTVIDGSGDLELTFHDGTEVRFDLDGNVSGHVFTIRYLPDDYIGLTFQASNSQVFTGATGGSSLSGQPTGNPYVDSLIGGFAKWNTNVITYHFGTTADIHPGVDEHGETTIVECDSSVGDIDAAPRAALGRAFAAVSSVTNISFVETSSVTNANVTFWMVDEIVGDPSGFTEMLTDMPDGRLWVYYDQDQLTAATTGIGGFGAAAITHEIGHVLGLAHPHDGGSQPDGTTFAGVPRGDSGGLGVNGQNQEIYSVMSYNEGLAGAGDHDTSFGTQITLGAFDIAALQVLYGVNTNHNPTDTYVLPTINAVGTGWTCIWDTGGSDVITNAGSNLAATIDLRAAPLLGPNAGGYASHVQGIAGGFTIANGVAIENAIGGNGNDTITGNSLDNTFDGRSGNDVIDGGEGLDTALFSGATSAYEIERSLDSVVVTGPDGRDVLVATERLSFLDGTINVADLPISGGQPGNGVTTFGTTGNDTFHATGGSASLNGVGGHDILVFSGIRADYTVTDNGDGTVTISDHVSSRDFIHQVVNVELLQFSDQNIFIENADNANIARLYSAALDRVPDTGGLFGWEDIYAGNIPASVKAQGVYVLFGLQY